MMFEGDVIPAREVPIELYMSNRFNIVSLTCPTCGETFAMPHPIETDPDEVDRVAQELLLAWSQGNCGHREPLS